MVGVCGVGGLSLFAMGVLFGLRFKPLLANVKV